MKGDLLRKKSTAQYRELMVNIGQRFEFIRRARLSSESDYFTLENAAFQLRKSIEGIAFGCLVASENGLKEIPRDAKGQWNAEKIFSRISRIKPLVFPVSFVRTDPVEGVDDVQHVLNDNELVNLSINTVTDIYRRTHRWAHEFNPYVPLSEAKFDDLRSKLLDDVNAIKSWISQHGIYADKELLLVMMDHEQGSVKVFAASSGIEYNNAQTH